MTQSISSNVNINTAQLLRAANAFKQSVKKQNEQENSLEHEAVKVPEETKKIFANHDINEIRQVAQSIGENDLSDEDIKYGLYYGRSVIVNYSV